MNDVSGINVFLNQFLQTVDTGFGLLSAPSESLMEVLLLLNVVTAAFFWMFGTDVSAGQIARRIVSTGVLIWIVRQWDYLTWIVYSSFASGGLRAGGSTLTTEQFLNPGAVAQRGVTILERIAEKMGSLSGPAAFFWNFIEIASLGFAWVAVLAAFFILAIGIFFAVLIFQVGSLLALLTMPFALFKPTAWIAERPVAWVFSSGLRVASMALVVGLTESLMVGMVPATLDELTAARTSGIILGSFLMLAMTILAPRYAADLVSGGPSLGAGTFAAAGAGTARTVAAGAAAGEPALAATRAAASVVQASAGPAAGAAATGVGVLTGSSSAREFGASVGSVVSAGRGAWAARPVPDPRSSTGRHAQAASRLLDRATGGGGGGGGAPSF
ncbi:type IV secretion system protein [Phycisphaera mikurensis]|uniref:Putative conjugal transfer protein TrbL n=1 Tax=Phycisphaera mikurensis (strain NBRC 102666 / KCTC 22515 / FYK2301M01) TaxID=1142394 RepID=I0IJI8_PHYMF|nr:type IV secretion system protein [Phycisphaera mikurensis]MBB6443176.1 type IV secretion system protein TrbL [Phycisphaera mikurensis]BAM05426.1 putative conjugal transfer protein TrbL [Phycisphaera mikurensis NBRC 102666]